MIPPLEFVDYISNIERFSHAKIVEIKSEKKWSVALLGDEIHLHLIHYKTVEEGKIAWYRREKRINLSQAYYILVETDGYSYEDLQRFDNLPYRHKVALTHKAYPEIKCAFQIKGYEKIGAVTDSYRFQPILPFRMYDQFNWYKFLDGKNIHKRKQS